MINNFAIDMGIWETPIKLAQLKWNTCRNDPYNASFYGSAFVCSYAKD